MNENETNTVDEAAELLDAQSPEGVQVYKFNKPVTVNGKTYTEITMDFDSLTGADMEAIANAMPRKVVAPVLEFNQTYINLVVARAAKININDLKAFPMKDVTQMSMMAKAFLMSAD